MKALLTLRCSDHPETVSSEKAILAAQQITPNSFADFLTYITRHILSLASTPGGRYVLEIPPLSPSPATQCLNSWLIINSCLIDGYRHVKLMLT